MRIKVISILVVVSLMASLLCSCGADSEPVYNMDDSYSTDESAESLNLSFDDVNISKGLYNYMAKFYKDYYMSIFNSMVEYYGYLSSSSSITVEDTEAFWNTVVPEDVYNYLLYFRSAYKYNYAIGADGLGKSTFGDFVVDHVNSECEAYLVYNALADHYDYVLSRDHKDYQTGLTAAISLEISKKDFLDGLKDISDEKGVPYDWVMDAWEVNLAGDGITKDEWVSLFYDFPLLMNNLSGKIADTDDVKLSDDDVFKVYLEEINSVQVSFNYIAYDILTKEAYEAQRGDGEASEESSEAESSEAESSETESSETESSEAEDSKESIEDPLAYEADTYEEYVELRKSACKDIHENIVNGTVSFEQALEESPHGDYIKENSPNGAYLNNDSFASMFGKTHDEVKDGEIELFVFEKNHQIWILQYIVWEEDDFTAEEKAEVVKAYADTAKSREAAKIIDAAYNYVDGTRLDTEDFKPWEI